jgi:ferrous iron transport protein A
MTLDQLHIGEIARIIGFAPTEKAYRRKLLAMGLTPGTPLQIKRLAPLGCPLELHVRGFSLLLRKKEASAVHVEKVSHE